MYRPVVLSTFMWLGVVLCGVHQGTEDSSFRQGSESFIVFILLFNSTSPMQGTTETWREVLTCDRTFRPLSDLPAERLAHRHHTAGDRMAWSQDCQ